MMGHGMAKNLLARGHALSFLVHRDRSRLADLVAAGAREVASPAALAQASDVVILCNGGGCYGFNNGRVMVQISHRVVDDVFYLLTYLFTDDGFGIPMTVSTTVPYAYRPLNR